MKNCYKTKYIVLSLILVISPKGLVNYTFLMVWVERNFADQLIFHSRAIDSMDRVGPNEVDLNLLCNAIEFLATDYRDELLHEIDEDELHIRSQRKYGRLFKVTPLTSTTVDIYASIYRIKYYTGFKGKQVDSTLDLHLSVGTDSDHLIRIYFLYDKEKKLIVVGSLPYHLRTASYS